MLHSQVGRQCNASRGLCCRVWRLCVGRREQSARGYVSRAESYLSQLSPTWIEAEGRYGLAQRDVPLKFGPEGIPIHAPSLAVAELIKLEWIAKAQEPKHAALPLVSTHLPPPPTDSACSSQHQ